MAHLGPHAFPDIGGEVVQSTSFVIRKSDLKKYIGLYIRLVDYNNAEQKETIYLSHNNSFNSSNESFDNIPGKVIAYWISDKFRNIFLFDKMSNYGNSCIGMRTGANERFLRLWFEINYKKFGISCKSSQEALESNKKWFPYCKGGAFRKWYGNNEYLVNWEFDGYEIKENTRRIYPELEDNLSWKISNENYYFKKGITWSGVGASKFSVRCYPDGMIFDSGANSYFVNDNNNYYYFAGLLNTKPINTTIKIINPTINTGSGVISILPAKYDKNKSNTVSESVQQNISISRTDWDSFETSWDFKKHPLLCGKKTISESFADWQTLTEDQFKQLKSNEEELNRIFIEIYGLQNELTPEVEDKDVTIRKAALGRDIRSLISYAVGCMFGRYSLDMEGLAYAGGEWDDEKYTIFIPNKDNIIPILDEDYFKDDITARFVDFIRAVYGEATLEENLNFIAQAINSRGGNSRDIIRYYFLNDFYKDHVKIYQKRPIYWLFDSGKENGFKALIYMHRYTTDTIGKLRIEYLHKIQTIYEGEIGRLQRTAQFDPSAVEKVTAQRRLEKLQKQLKETKDYDEKIAHLALSRIAIDLDDGVKVNYEKVQTGQDGNKLEVLGKI
jgi:type II restriction/modification system DNA methylase subunit YeeA